MSNWTCNRCGSPNRFPLFWHLTDREVFTKGPACRTCGHRRDTPRALLNPGDWVDIGIPQPSRPYTGVGLVLSVSGLTGFAHVEVPAGHDVVFPLSYLTLITDPKRLHKLNMDRAERWMTSQCGHKGHDYNTMATRIHNLEVELEVVRRGEADALRRFPSLDLSYDIVLQDFRKLEIRVLADLSLAASDKKKDGSEPRPQVMEALKTWMSKREVMFVVVGGKVFTGVMDQFNMYGAGKGNSLTFTLRANVTGEWQSREVFLSDIDYLSTRDEAIRVLTQ